MYQCLEQPNKHSDSLLAKQLQLQVPNNEECAAVSIKESNQEHAEIWDQQFIKSKTNPNPRSRERFEPSGIMHVGQYFGNRKGNCYDYHIRMGETPCTPWEKCISNDETKQEQLREDHKDLYHNQRRRKGFRIELQSDLVQGHEKKVLTKPVKSDFTFEDYARRYFRYL